MASPADLSEVLLKQTVDEKELTPFVEEFLRNDPGIPTIPASMSQREPGQTPLGLLGGLIPTPGTFRDPAWWAYKKVWGIHWDVAGTFSGEPMVVANGGRDYIFRGGNGFSFTRSSGEVITPGPMITDGGSIPRICWSIPGLNPWDYMPAFLIHDWDFMAHHCKADYPRSFEQANLTLAEGVYTLMANGTVPEDWRVLVAIFLGVSSFIGRKVWGRQWTPDQCQVALNPK